MRLSNTDWNFFINFEEDKIHQMVFERPSIMQRYIFELVQQSNGSEGGFVFSENDKIMNMSKNIDMILDPFRLDCNNKKIMSGLYEVFCTAAVESEMYMQTQETVNTAIEFIEKLGEYVDYPIDYKCDLGALRLLKAFDVKLPLDATNLGELIVDYTNLMTEFCGIKCFIFVNLKTYFDEEALLNLYQQWRYKKNNILLIENNKGSDLDGEKTWILDNDMCEIF